MLHLILGGAADHRCDKWLAFHGETAAEPLLFPPDFPTPLFYPPRSNPLAPPLRFGTASPKIPYIAPAHQPHLVNCPIPFAV